jgi:DNA-binding IclR family transcriptional regulator
VAAISLAALTSRIAPRLGQLVPPLRKAAEELSREYAQKDAA